MAEASKPKAKKSKAEGGKGEGAKAKLKKDDAGGKTKLKIVEGSKIKQKGNDDDPPMKDGDILPIINWGKSEVDEFKKLWKQMVGTTQGDLRALGITLLIWMFENIPDMKKLFQTFDTASGSLASDERFLKHAQGVVFQLNKLINKLDRPSFYGDVRALAKKHLNMTVQVNVKYFKDFRDNFHLLVLDIIGEDKDSRQAEQWYQFLDAFCAIFQEEEDAWHAVKDTAKQQVVPGCCPIS